MVKKMGVIFYNGKVIDVELIFGDELINIEVKLNELKFILIFKYLIDVVGQRFIIGKKIDNFVFEFENFMGLNIGLVWM